MNLVRLLLGRPLRDSEADEERLGVASGVPVLGLDALASSAYGPEAALVLLLPLGRAGPREVLPIVLVVSALLLVVQTSYRQTIGAYPEGGGSYTVAKNLGLWASLLAGASLCVDYVLNVAVAISAGVGALVSALPALAPHTLALCLALLALLTLTNLRGLRAAGLAFMVPTYAFVATLGGSLAWGLARAVASGGHPAAAVAPPAPAAAATGLSAWLLVRSFAAGCTAMTGVEAVSNAVPVFRPPSVDRARRTLSAIVAILVVLLVGIALLARAYGIGATVQGEPGYQSVLSQVVAAVAGRGALYGVTMASVVAVLCLSANTSFADFPRLCRAMALDRFLPEAFAHAGRRLVYSTGIVALALFSGALLAAFRGITDRLIPLFAVGAFGAFTLSQAGMVAHWRRERGDPRARRRMLVNGAGAVLTGATLAVIVASKFREGAWLTVICIPAVVLFLRRTRARHDALAAAVASHGAPLDATGVEPPVCVVPVRQLDEVTLKALRFALSISGDVRAVQVLADGRECEDLSGCWEERVAAPARAAGRPAPRLERVRSRYRQVLDPILAYVHHVAAEDRERFVTVVVPELVRRRWYHTLLFSHTATLLKVLLLFRGGPQVTVVDAPWRLSERRAWWRWRPAGGRPAVPRLRAT